ncbi:hypothetical protein BJX63DRAFT_83124 [Aspergillus granulosus]|uniref:Uncharacterized protein n=1 Tax=Aspergillus granulosus TaxID=176169 RepID=A0ABR4HTJ8_9EURO
MVLLKDKAADFMLPRSGCPILRPLSAHIPQVQPSWLSASSDPSPRLHLTIITPRYRFPSHVPFIFLWIFLLCIPLACRLCTPRLFYHFQDLHVLLALKPYHSERPWATSFNLAEPAHGGHGHMSLFILYTKPYVAYRGGSST